MSISNKEVIELVEDARKNLRDLTHITNKIHLSHEERLKISLCKYFVKYLNDKGITLTELSRDLDLPKSRVSEIVNYKIKTFTLDKLIQNLGRLAEFSPKTREYLHFIEEAFELPAMSVSDTRQLTRQIRDVGRHGSKSSFFHARS